MTELAGLAWPDIESRPAGLLAVPVGSTEQHGPHLPLSTDTDIAVELARRLEQRRPDVLVAPAVSYGSSGEHEGFAGTLSIGSPALVTVLAELARSAGRFDGVLFISTHGGNAEPVASSVALLVREGRAVRAWSPGVVDALDSHAGWVETSVMLAIRPAAVQAARARPGTVRPLDEVMPALRKQGVKAVSPNGVLGDPSGASAEKGLRILEDWVDDLEKSLAGWP